MEKIKSVRLKRKYRDAAHILFANQYATKIQDCKGGAFWQFKTEKGSQYSFSEQTIRINFTDLFEIEYEQERKYIDFRIEADTRFTLPGEQQIKELCESLWIADVKVTEIGRGTL